ncbi:10830_t:CDS:2, partial [Gigaspora rosea]
YCRETSSNVIRSSQPSILVQTTPVRRTRSLFSFDKMPLTNQNRPSHLAGRLHSQVFLGLKIGEKDLKLGI